ncbi:hypothetical protein ACCO45_000872 [Purpureocillium lilacinum]|uniref:Uncharacterized protein n=1 Tax=Purpureocillium lilacinum TaxID=33203 RepID=A0ACC4E6B2_PURLI
MPLVHADSFLGVSGPQGEQGAGGRRGAAAPTLLHVCGSCLSGGLDVGTAPGSKSLQDRILGTGLTNPHAQALAGGSPSGRGGDSLALRPRRRRRVPVVDPAASRHRLVGGGNRLESLVARHPISQPAATRSGSDGAAALSTRRRQCKIRTLRGAHLRACTMYIQHRRPIFLVLVLPPSLRAMSGDPSWACLLFENLGAERGARRPGSCAEGNAQKGNETSRPCENLSRCARTRQDTYRDPMHCTVQSCAVYDVDCPPPSTSAPRSASGLGLWAAVGHSMDLRGITDATRAVALRSTDRLPSSSDAQ